MEQNTDAKCSLNLNISQKKYIEFYKYEFFLRDLWTYSRQMNLEILENSRIFLRYF